MGLSDFRGQAFVRWGGLWPETLRDGHLSSHPEGS